MNFVVDVEATGPIPHKYSMIELGAVAILPDETFSTFHINIYPTSPLYVPEAIAAIGLTWEEINDPKRNNATPIVAMKEFRKWILDLSAQNKYRPTMWSDNIAFDWSFINYYFHTYLGENPFGYSGRRIGDVWAGLQKDIYKPWKQMRVTPHDHNPVNDAMGNAEVLIKLKHKYGLKIKF